MNHNRGRNGRMDFGRIRDRSTADTTATNKSFAAGIVAFILMILSAAGPTGIFVLLILGIFAFIMNNNLISLSFELDENGDSQLKTIGDNAFFNCNLTYPEGTPLFIPPSVTSMGIGVFYGNSNLKQIRFTGDTTGFDNEWNSGIPVITE